MVLAEAGAEAARHSQQAAGRAVKHRSLCQIDRYSVSQRSETVAPPEDQKMDDDIPCTTRDEPVDSFLQNSHQPSVGVLGISLHELRNGM